MYKLINVYLISNKKNLVFLYPVSSPLTFPYFPKGCIFLPPERLDDLEIVEKWSSSSSSPAESNPENTYEK